MASGSPAADIELTVCGPPRISPLGAGYGDLQPYCGTKSPLVGAVLETPYDPQIVVTIRPREAGVVHIEGFDVRYRDGLQVGTQHTGSEITITVEG